MRTLAIIFFSLVVSCFGAALLFGATPFQSVRIAPTPLAAVPALLDLFEQYSIVALSEGPHNNQKGHEFRMALVHDPRFARLVNDVVVESGSSRYQSVMDRFTAGEAVPYNELRHVWENTTQPGPIWDSPIYFEFFTAIRDVNRATGSHIRIILGDPPIDWASIQNAGEINAYYPQRSPYAAAVIEQEVLKKNHRALIVYGEGHLLSSGPLGENTLVTILRRESKARIFTISNGYPDLSKFQTSAAWPIPSLIMVKGTTVGMEPSAAGTPLEQDFDAVLHLGGPTALSFPRVPVSVCRDPEYLKMRFDRFALTATPENPDPGSQLKSLCGLTGVR